MCWGGEAVDVTAASLLNRSRGLGVMKSTCIAKFPPILTLSPPDPLQIFGYDRLPLSTPPSSPPSWPGIVKSAPLIDSWRNQAHLMLSFTGFTHHLNAMSSSCSPRHEQNFPPIDVAFGRSIPTNVDWLWSADHIDRFR